MNYKSIVSSRKLRVYILTFFNWIPNEIMLRVQYRMQTGRKLNLKNAQRFTEKIQIYKLRYHNPSMLRCTDKYEVRKYIKEKGLEKILIPLTGIYSKVSDIDYDGLPQQFVAKTTDGGGRKQVLICRNKKKLFETDFRNELQGWMKAKKVKKQAGREWAYENGFPRRIIIEKLIEPEIGEQDLRDYKFYCFNGKPTYCQLIQDRSTKETIDFYDMDWNHMPFYGLNPLSSQAAKPAAKPASYREMKEIACRLSTGFPFVRVDLYCSGQKVYFGELTFYPASGYGCFTPDEWDYKLGNLFDTNNWGIYKQ